MADHIGRGQQTTPKQQRPGGPWPSADKAVAMILFGERYSNDRLHFMSRIMGLMFVALLVSLIGNISMLPNPPRYRYIPISNSGLVLPQVPLSQANHEDQFVVDWTIDAVTRLYSFDFLNYRAQWQDAKKNLTSPGGWDSFEASMKANGNFNAIIGNSFVLTAVPTGAGKIISSELVAHKDYPAGLYQWTVQFPMLVSYRSSTPQDERRKTEGRVITDALNMTVVVSRVPVFLNHNGLGVKSMVARR